MNTRILSIVAAVMLVSISSGCSGMRNFLFGKGARCGLCNSAPGGMQGPQFGNTMQAPRGGPSCGQSWPGPASGHAGPPQGCGPDCYTSEPHAGGGYSCGSCGTPMSGGGYTDPYMTGGTAGMPQSAPTMVPQIQGDDFSARRFDNDGSRILWEEPYYGGTSL